ncbi:MAG: HAMP domain-containing histidine kinase [Hyphomicrobium sp.]|nr:HAMP domain-containing histidine kinase [Hyphomicrobium sp.]
MKTNSLRNRLLLAAAGVIAIALAIAAFGLSTLFERHVKTWIDGELDAHMTQLIAGLDRAPSGDLAVITAPSDPRFDTPMSGLYWQITLDGKNRDLRSRSLWDFVIAMPADPALDEQSHHHSVAGPDDQRLYLMQRHLELPPRLDRQRAKFAVAIDEAQINSAVWRFAGALAPLLGVLGALLIAAAWVQVSVGLKPLSSISSRIAGIRTGSERRLGDDFPDEVQPLAREIDTLLDARDQQIARARTSAADLAHGLKTPLQVVLGGITHLKAKGETAIAGDLESAALMMQRHVERQLARARMQSISFASSADAAAVARQVISVLQRTPNGARLAWSIDIAPATFVRIHADDLAEALGGLLENAARHAKSSVVVNASRDGNRMKLSIADDGPGIPADKIAEAVRRGGRIDTSGPGTGLGLAIVSEIVEAWGGDLAFSHGNGGFAVTLTLDTVAPR